MHDETTVSYVMNGRMRVNGSYSMPVRVCLGSTLDEAMRSLTTRFSGDAWLVESVSKVTKTVHVESVAIDI